jgi:hypothetical protein
MGPYGQKHINTETCSMSETISRRHLTATMVAAVAAAMSSTPGSASATESPALHAARLDVMRGRLIGLLGRMVAELEVATAHDLMPLPERVRVAADLAKALAALRSPM